MQSLIQPAIDFYSGLSSGDPEKQTKAAFPLIQSIDQQYKQAREQILLSTPPGPVRDASLAKLERERGASTGSVFASTTTTAVDKLANIGSGLGSFSLNETGAGLRASEGASATQSSVLQAEAAGKASTMSFLGELAGAGGSVLGAKLA